MRGDPWLMISSLGIGTYLGEPDQATVRLTMYTDANFSAIYGGTVLVVFAYACIPHVNLAFPT